MAAMELVLGTHGFAGFGGSETYLMTVAQQLERLGHRVTVQAAELGPMADAAEARGVRIARRAEDLPEAPHATIVQDGVMALELAKRYPGVAQLFVGHADAIDLQLPPQLPGVVSAVVIFNDRVAERIAASALEVETVRLRQPIDLDWFAPAGRPRDRPQRLLAFSNYLRGPRRELVDRVCGRLGIEVMDVDTDGGRREDPRGAILAADVVLGYGRSVLEGMACGRPAYVFDHKGGDGWVTPESYPALEADGFGGRASETLVTAERLSEDLARYQPEMGVTNRDLAVAHHAANRHAAELVELLRRLVPQPALENGMLPELARLSRVQWQFEHRALEAVRENHALREELEAATAAASHARERLRLVKATRRYRLGATLGRLADAARRR
jgi:hypothetical protein